MIELCDGSLQGMASTMNLLAYYNDIFGGALKHELEILNGMMASKLCEAKNDVKGLDLECRFDEEQGLISTDGTLKLTRPARDRLWLVVLKSL